MEKPISVSLEEFKTDLVNTITSSQLPVVIVDLVLKDLYTEIHNLAMETTKKDIQEYNKILSV